jgi:hypothetical protein
VFEVPVEVVERYVGSFAFAWGAPVPLWGFIRECEAVGEDVWHAVRQAGTREDVRTIVRRAMPAGFAVDLWSGSDVARIAAVWGPLTSDDVRADVVMFRRIRTSDAPVVTADDMMSDRPPLPWCLA